MEKDPNPPASAAAPPPAAGAAVAPAVIQQPPAPVPQASQYTVQTQVTQPGVNQMVVVHQHLPRECPGQMQCPHCKTTVTTRISYKNGWMTWFISLMLFLLLCWPCCIIPFFVNACKDVEHSCPICNNVIHVHRLGDRSY